ncbi:Rpn family recombination-promoting nuclease/putative transposase [Parabacteroides sp.]|uniref:Rpn family recombination-promoting nuclease/putative transposase n=1 Tax=Parabacteroides sp. TaxID=1869337 RepID=UPI002581038F|nr:Rpn family recombination-promoting nuclease/putative transposase [Parabacteroides sp.]
MKNKSSLVRFDWAIKRLLRQKSNFVVLEGLLSTLLEEDVVIVRILESEGNKEDSEDKFNRVDVLAENSKGELVIIEVQNNRELDYFHRMLYGTSKAVTEYIHEGEKYGTIKKIYSVNIIYFDLGQGKDYVYHGKTQFKGIHFDDILKLSTRQREQFVKQEAGDIFPEYYVLRVNEFDELAKTPLDEWIYFLKTGEIDEHATAKGLPEAREKLRIDKLSPSEKSQYHAHMEALRYQRSVIETGWIEGHADGFAEGKAKGKAEGFTEGQNKEKRLIAANLKKQGLSYEIIASCTGLSPEEIASC